MKLNKINLFFSLFLFILVLLVFLSESIQTTSENIVSEPAACFPSWRRVVTEESLVQASPYERHKEAPLVYV